MTIPARIQTFLLTGAIMLVGVALPAQAAPPSGELKGQIRNQWGEPLANILVAFADKSSQKGLPILTRSDDSGQIQLENVRAGNYQISVKSSEYRASKNAIIEIVPGQTALVTLVLQQLFDLKGSGDGNMEVKTLLRQEAGGRLIFRGLPGDPGQSDSSRDLFQRAAVFEVYSSSGLGDDYFVFPGDSAGGTSTNFAVTQSLGGLSDYILAGQINSGEDSLWRLKNIVRYPLGEKAGLNLFVGYGRLSFDQPSLSLLNNPVFLGDELDYTRAAGTTKILSAGFENTLRFSRFVSASWGVEFNQVRTDQTHSFFSPSAEVSFHPLQDTTVRLMMASKRLTRSGSLMLGEGDVVNLSDSVFFSRVGNRFSIGTSRYYQGSIEQRLDPNTSLEVAAYRNQLFGGSVPFVAILEYSPDIEVFQLDNQQAENSGYRLSLKRKLGEHLNSRLSYLRGDAVGLQAERLTLFLDEQSIRSLLHRNAYHAVSAEIEASIPVSQTRLTALVKLVPSGKPITPLDAFSNFYGSTSEGVDLFVRQILPLPDSFLSFLGLDFLSTYQLEVLLDIHNLTNEQLGQIETALGDVVLSRSPRSLRGGIAVKF